MSIPSSYVCPHCGTKTVSEIHPVIERVFEPFDVTSYARNHLPYDYKKVELEDIAKCYDPSFICITKCLECNRPSLWHEDEIVWPVPKGIPPKKEMPPEAKKFFKEAQEIIHISPRAACALLRIALELLVNYVGKLSPTKGFREKDRLYDRINSLGVDPLTKDLLHTCRLTGNEFAHPGVINVEGKDTLKLAVILSRLINHLVVVWIMPYVDMQRAKEMLEK